MSPTLHVDCVHLADGTLSLRCPTHPGWRGPKSNRADRANVEKNLKAWQTQHTSIEWWETPPLGDLPDLGLER